MTVEEHLRTTIGDLVLKLASQAATIDRLTAELQSRAEDPLPSTVVQPRKTNGALPAEPATLASSDGAK